MTSIRENLEKIKARGVLTKVNGRIEVADSAVTAYLLTTLETTLEQLDVAVGALDEAHKALKQNQQWHVAYDEYDGYADSELCTINTNAIIGARNALSDLAGIEKGVE